MGVGIGRKMSSSSLPQRAYYPSGPWINGVRPSEPYSPPAPAPVKKKAKKKTEPKLPNPDPDNYKIIAVAERGDFMVTKINYPDCTNYEGNKILVFQGVKLLDLINQKLIDPHFCSANPKYAFPIARFTPTDEGWQMALRFAEAESQIKAA